MKKQRIVILAVIIIGLIVFYALFLITEKNFLKKEEPKFNLKEEKTILDLEGDLRIGFITDAHCYADQKDNGEWELNWRCQRPLEAFVKNMADFNPDFVIQNGDFVCGEDGRAKETFVEANQIYEKISVPKYHVLGNHETRNFFKDEWLEIVGYEKPYYSFDVNGYKIIVLDGNNKPSSDMEISETSPDKEFYPGFINPVQMEWLKDVFEKSKEINKIVFVHQPLMPEETKTQIDTFVGGEETRKLFSENNVLAVFSGHVERLCYFEEDGVEYYVSHGFMKANQGLRKEYQFKDHGFYSKILIKGDEVKVYSFFNPNLKNATIGMGYESIEINLNTADCISGKTLTDEKRTKMEKR